MKEKDAKKQLVFSSIILSISGISAVINTMIADVLWLRFFGIVVIIACSMGLGAFVRELFILKAREREATRSIQQSND